MSNKKETPVRWLIEQILELPLEEGTNAAHLKEHVNKVTVFDHALQMESQKQQKYDEMLGMLEELVLDLEDESLQTSMNDTINRAQQLVKEAKEL